MKLRMRGGLPFVTAAVTAQGQRVILRDVVLDTGSVGMVFAADALARIGLVPEPDDSLHRIRGVGGVEYVVAKQVSELRVGPLRAQNFAVELGGMDYGFALDGILGLDFLRQTGAVINLQTLTLTRHSRT